MNRNKRDNSAMAGQARGLGRLRPTTFRARITLVMTLLALMILALVDVIVFLGRRSMFQNNMDIALRSIAQAEATSVAGTVGDILPTPGNSMLLFPMPPGSTLETYATIMDYRGHVLAHTANLPHPPFWNPDTLQKARTETGSAFFEDVLRNAKPVRCLYYPFVNSRHVPLIAIVAVSEEPIVGSLRALTALLCGSLALGVLGFAFASFHLSARLTRPLADIAAVAHNIGETNLHARIPEVSRDAELRDVTEVLNEMLERLETAFTQQQAFVIAQQRFAADASHELRSPLSNLYGTVEVALRRPRAPEDYRETLSVALSEIQRLSRLVEDLLTLSRADAGQFPLNRQAADLGAIARASAQAYRVRAEQNGVALQISTPHPTPIYGDTDRLRQVIDNLLDNALKYAPPGSTVAIATRRQGQECRLEARDQGPGLSPDDAARIFHRFYRADLSRTRASGGAGLGLAIAQAIAQAHGGTITVESEPGVGTAFYVHLPAEEN